MSREPLLSSEEQRQAEPPPPNLEAIRETNIAALIKTKKESFEPDEVKKYVVPEAKDFLNFLHSCFIFGIHDFMENPNGASNLQNKSKSALDAIEQAKRAYTEATRQRLSSSSPLAASPKEDMYLKNYDAQAELIKKHLDQFQPLIEAHRQKHNEGTYCPPILPQKG